MQKKRKIEKENKAITLIALVITIIVLLILAGVTIAALSGDNGILTNATKAKYATELSQYNEELQNYKANKLLENLEFEGATLISAENSLDYNTKPKDETGNIYNVITSLKGSHFDGKLEVIKGELLLNSQNKAEIEVAQSVGIAVNPYEITDEGELVSSNGNLLLMDENTGTLRLPESVTSIGEGAFADLEGLKTIIIPGTVKEIKKEAFRGNKDLETVIMEEGVEIIGYNAFQGCPNLTNVNMPQSLKEIRNQAFDSDSNIKQITIPSGVKIIGSYCFSSATGLTKVIIENGVETIQTSAFASCSSLSQIELPESLKSMGNSVFNRCINLEIINIDPKNQYYVYENGMLLPKDKSEILFISDKILKQSSTFEIPSGIKSFSAPINNYENITKLIIPQSLNYINIIEIPTSISAIEVDSNNTNMIVENNCLYSYDKKTLLLCFTKEKTVTLSENLEKLEGFSFKAASNIEEIILPESVKNIETQVFTENTKLKTLKIGKNVSYIDPIFKYMNGNGEVIIDEENPYYTIENNILYNKEKTELIAVIERIQGNFIVPENIEKIGDRAFHNQKKMTSIELPTSLKEIGNSFNFCNGLVEITIPANVEKIGNNCFASAVNLEKIKINKPANSIEYSPWGAMRGVRVVEWQN